MKRALLLLVLIACKKEEPKPPPIDAAVSAPGLKHKKGGMNVEFLVVSDTHVGYGDIDRDDARMLRVMERAAPPKTRGLVITGDLTEYGTEAQWTRWLEVFGNFQYPIFEMVGNHDKVAKGPWVEQQISARHRDLNPDPKARFYSWDWDDLHLVALGEAPDDDGLAFLEKDLALRDKSDPVVLFFHLALLGPWSTGNWFDDRYKDRLYRLIKDRNVPAIFHGHHHATEHYMWRGLDVWKPGAVKNGAHTFAIVHATDSSFEVRSYNWDSETEATPFMKRL